MGFRLRVRRIERETFQPRVMLGTHESDRNAGYDFLEV